MLKNLPENERPREKMMTHGVHSLSTSELIAIILRTGNKDQSALQIGHDLVHHCSNSIHEMSQMTLNELCKVNGIGESKACQLISAIELGKRLSVHNLKKRDKIQSPNDVIQYFTNELSHLKVEKFIAVFLNTKNEIILWEVISMGSLNASIVHPRELFNRAIKNSAASIIVLHNHPSGHVKPSNEDVLLTKRLHEVGQIVGIPVIDHIIIGQNGYYSFKEENLL